MTRAFFGRNEELEEFQVELRDPRGSAILVVGQTGMGKTMLLNRFMDYAASIDGLRCGTVREEVTPSDTVEAVLALLMDRVHEAACVTEGSLETTPRRLEQWRSLLNVIGIGDLAMSLRRDPKRNSRDQFLAAMERIAERMPRNGRAVFMIDPEKYVPKQSDHDWSIVIRRLPNRIKLVFAQRPEDALADSDTIAQLDNMVRIPKGNLDVLDDSGYEELINSRAAETRQTARQLKDILAPYGRHPYAVVVAADLLASGVSPDQLPGELKPTEFAATQWKQIQRGGYLGANPDCAIRLFQAYAILDVPVPDEVVEYVSGLSGAQRLALSADRFLGPLLRDENGRRRIYHAILADHITSTVSQDQIRGFHERAIEVYRQRLNQDPPDRLAAQRLALHVRRVEGDTAFVECLVDHCTPRLRQLGLLEDVHTLTAQALRAIAPDTPEAASLHGNLGNIMQIRGDLDAARVMWVKARDLYSDMGAQQLADRMQGWIDGLS